MPTLNRHIMLQRTSACFLFLAAVAIAHAAGFDSLMPKPLKLEMGVGRVVVSDSLRINVPAQAPARVREIAGVFADELKAQTSLAGRIVSSDAIEAGAVTLVLQTPSAAESCARESYSVEINKRGIVVAAASTEGLLWGVQTLLQGIELEDG
jgi:N-acetyl-beta-hexosaminidase